MLPATVHNANGSEFITCSPLTSAFRSRVGRAVIRAPSGIVSSMSDITHLADKFLAR
jgi:hypothetical protein